MKTLGEILYENGNLIYFGEYGDYAGEADFCISTHEAVANAVIAEYERRQWTPKDGYEMGERQAFLGYCPDNQCTFEIYCHDERLYYFGGEGDECKYEFSHFRPLPAPPEVQG